MKLCVIYLASPRAFQESEFGTSRMKLLKYSLAMTRRVLPTTDVYVFHEDYTQTEFDQLLGVTKFIQIDFSGFEQFRTPGLRRPYGYLMMCRFFSGIVQAHPILQDYTHYMRLDDDSYLIKPYITDETVMKCLQHDYVFRSIFHDEKDQQTLFDFTIQFLATQGFGEHISRLYQYLHNQRILVRGSYTGLAPYNNFHIASLRLWKQPLVQAYIRALEDCHGILQYGWMDANIHAMIIFVIAPFTDIRIHHESSFGYRHNQHFAVENSQYVQYVKDIPFYPKECVESETRESQKEETK